MCFFLLLDNLNCVSGIQLMNDHMKFWVVTSGTLTVLSNAIQFSHTGYHNLRGSQISSLENREHFIFWVLNNNISFLLPVTTRQYITALAQSGTQETDNGEPRAQNSMGF